MNGNFKQLGAAVAALFTDKQDEEIAARARIERLPKIIEARELITLQTLALIAADEMPENFELTREAYVALAQIAMRALDTVQRVAESATSHEPRH